MKYTSVIFIPCCPSNKNITTNITITGFNYKIKITVLSKLQLPCIIILVTCKFSKNVSITNKINRATQEHCVCVIMEFLDVIPIRKLLHALNIVEA